MFDDGALPGRVRIETQHHLARKPAELLCLLRGQRRSARRHHALEPCLIDLCEIEVALDENRELPLSDRVLAQIQTVQRSAF